MQVLCEEVEKEFDSADEGASPKTARRRAAQAEATAEEDEPPKKKRKSKELEERGHEPQEQASSGLSLPKGSAPGPLSEQQQNPPYPGDDPFVSFGEMVQGPSSPGKDMHGTLSVSAAPTAGASSSTTVPELDLSDLLGSSDWQELLEMNEETELEDWFLDPTADVPLIPSPGPSHVSDRDDEPGEPQSEDENLWLLLEAARQLQGDQHATTDSSDSETSSTPSQVYHSPGLTVSPQQSTRESASEVEVGHPTALAVVSPCDLRTI